MSKAWSPIRSMSVIIFRRPRSGAVRATAALQQQLQAGRLDAALLLVDSL
jgi:hypothetical protein